MTADIHDDPDDCRVCYYPMRKIIIEDFESDGDILDIGGGGESIIGRLKGVQVVAIDNRLSELEEAPAGPIKVVMDARQLAFPNSTFSTVTAFFSFMYMELPDVEAVLKEAYRVMKPGGRCYVWDTAIPTRLDAASEIVAFQLEIVLPGINVRTAYGRKWPDKRRGSRSYRDMVSIAGFDIEKFEESDELMQLVLRRPNR
jgi:ubiquinone/menaquinone biosynthesis C-methylase UbiE